MSATFCDGCGAKNREGARFCRACGQPLATSDAVAAAEPGAGETRTHQFEGSVPVRLRDALAPEYRLERKLGRGGMGIVYLATEAALERPVAIKLLPDEDGEDALAVERFLREARIAAKLRHPGIVSIHAVGQRRGLCFFTMDFVDGETLAQRVHREGPLPPAEATRFAAQVAEALAHAHAQGVVHRDLKPSNVMIDRAGHVLVLDFGLAKRHGTASLTATGVVHGTPEYIAPEQARGEPATDRSDVYALGLTWFFLLAGEHLFTGDSSGAVLAQHLTVDPRPRIVADERLPRAVHALLIDMIAKDPARRTASAAEAATQLRRLAGALGGEPGAEPSPTRVKPGRAAVSPAPAPGEALPATPSPATPRPPGATPTPGKKARERLKRLLDKLERKGE